MPTDETLREAIVALPDDQMRDDLQESLAGLAGNPADRTNALSRVLVSARRGMSHPASRRRFLEVGVDAYGLLEQTIAAAPADEQEDLARSSAVDAAFGAGLLTEEQWEALRSDVADGDESATARLGEQMTANVERAYTTVLLPWRHVAHRRSTGSPQRSSAALRPGGSSPRLHFPWRTIRDVSNSESSISTHHSVSATGSPETVARSCLKLFTIATPPL